MLPCIPSASILRINSIADGESMLSGIIDGAVKWWEHQTATRLDWLPPNERAVKYENFAREHFGTVS